MIKLTFDKREQMKRILILIDQTSGEKGKIFLKIIQKRIISARIEICSSIEVLERALKLKIAYFDKEIILLFADSITCLDQLYLKKQMLIYKKIVMVLPDNGAQIMAKAHRFFPRYFSFVDDQYDDLCDVLNKMITQ